MRIAHFSDLHFTKPYYGLDQFFSKRWIGNLHCLFHRRKEFFSHLSIALIDEFRRLGVTHAIISGDFTSTSLPDEFALAKTFIEKLQSHGVTCYTVPGNHDKYTRLSQKKKLYYEYFPDPDLMQKSLSVHALDEGLWLVLLDTAFATSWIHSTGIFTDALEKQLEKTLMTIPPKDRVIVVNHFPFFQSDHPLHTLKNGDRLQQVLLRHPHVQFYLHGHTHRHIFCDLRKSGLPIVLDSGSATLGKRATWNLIDCDRDGGEVRVFHWDQQWQEKRKMPYTWVCATTES